MRIPIILTAALALSLSGAIIVIGAVNPSSQSSAPRIEIGYLAQTQSADEWEGAWSDSLAVLYEERQTKITMEAFGLVGWQGWQISENGSLTNGLCPGNMEPVESEGDIKIQRLNCFDTNGTLIGFYEERWKWVSAQTVYELSVELPPDWPWSTDRIAEERATIESDASFNGVPVVYPMYLQDEFLTTGKVLKVLEGGSWVYQPCATKICHENQSWHTVDTAAIAAEEQYWARFSAYCLAIADFNNRLKRLTETDPELAWDPTVYERYSFNQSNYGNSNTEWMCQLPQLPPTEADWQPHVIWTP